MALQQDVVDEIQKLNHAWHEHVVFWIEVWVKHPCPRATDAGHERLLHDQQLTGAEHLYRGTVVWLTDLDHHVLWLEIISFDDQRPAWFNRQWT